MDWSVFVVLIVAIVGMLAMAIVVTAQLCRHDLKMRGFRHAERMRALELGIARPAPPPSGLDWPGAALCIALGVGFPLGAFALSTVAVVVGGDDGASFFLAMLASGAAIWTARGLAYRMLDRVAPAPGEVVYPATGSKPANFDPEAFDVVGSRG